MRHDEQLVARAHHPIDELVVLAERDVRKAAEGARRRRAVRQAAEEEALPALGVVDFERRHLHQVGQLQDGNVSGAAGDRRHLRRHAARLVEVIVVPVQDHLAARGLECERPLEADCGACRHR